ncbi:hypothetical protein [Mycobacteroides abscessus]|uniref:hypothetical protein n=1 Tax=Mycobacteroides abscessus TaxID=36809 RepID=UPI0009C7F73C|nr:hypothetical protein [Mycobacteroides abscessus]SKU22766.1 Uncharacterised protein [Mycobacteroides abscessus subsp. abscessus]
MTGHDLSRGMPRPAQFAPDDAGAHADALERILRRIPQRWGREISHGPGWYPIVVACHEQLVAIDPDYVVHQVKQKYGTLNYYCTSDAELTPEQWEAFDAITDQAARVSAVTCELCGDPGEMCERREWFKTLCVPCGEPLGYLSVARKGGAVEQH